MFDHLVQLCFVWWVLCNYFFKTTWWWLLMNYSLSSIYKFHSSKCLRNPAANLQKRKLSNSFSLQWRSNEPIKHMQWCHFEKIVNGSKPLSIFKKKLRHRSLIDSSYVTALWINSHWVGICNSHWWKPSFKNVNYIVVLCLVHNHRERGSTRTKYQ